jgi:hypothetical protein
VPGADSWTYLPSLIDAQPDDPAFTLEEGVWREIIRFERIEPSPTSPTKSCAAAIINWARCFRCSACEGREIDFVVSGAAPE